MYSFGAGKAASDEIAAQAFHTRLVVPGRQEFNSSGAGDA